MVDHPNDLDTQSRIDGESLILDVSCAPSDIGKIIGKSGRTITALRTIMVSVAAKYGKRIMLEIIEPAGGRHLATTQPPENHRIDYGDQSPTK